MDGPILFPLAILIEEGVQFLLAPLYLVSSYAWLDEWVGNIVRAVGTYNVILHVDSCFLQKFLLERFPLIAPKPIEVPAVVMEEMLLADGFRGMRTLNT